MRNRLGLEIYDLNRLYVHYYRDIQNAAGAGNSDAEYERLKLRLQDAQQKLDKVLSEKSDVGQQGPHETGINITPQYDSHKSYPWYSPSVEIKLEFPFSIYIDRYWLKVKCKQVKVSERNVKSLWHRWKIM